MRNEQLEEDKMNEGTAEGDKELSRRGNAFDGRCFKYYSNNKINIEKKKKRLIIQLIHKSSTSTMFERRYVNFSCSNNLFSK